MKVSEFNIIFIGINFQVECQFIFENAILPNLKHSCIVLLNLISWLVKSSYTTLLKEDIYLIMEAFISNSILKWLLWMSSEINLISSLYSFIYFLFWQHDFISYDLFWNFVGVMYKISLLKSFFDLSKSYFEE